MDLDLPSFAKPKEGSPQEEELIQLTLKAKSDIRALQRQKMRLNTQLSELKSIATHMEEGLGFTCDDAEGMGLDEDDDDGEGEGSDDDEDGVDEDLILDVLPVGHESLITVAEPVEQKEFGGEDLIRFVDQMVYTMRMHEGIGLAAPQVGVSQRVIVIGAEDKPDDNPDQVLPAEHLAKMNEEDFPCAFPSAVVVNPVLTPMPDSEDKAYFESCLSLPGFFALVTRPSHIRVQGFDVLGMPIDFEASGYVARVLQHEMDHLDGIMYTDIMEPKSFVNEEAIADDDDDDSDDYDDSDDDSDDDDKDKYEDAEDAAGFAGRPVSVL